MRIRKRSRWPALLLGAVLMLTPVASVQAQDAGREESPGNSPGEIAREGLEQMMRALRLLVERIPQYELPEVLENGDIIIRRKHPEEEPEEPEFDKTAT